MFFLFSYFFFFLSFFSFCLGIHCLSGNTYILDFYSPYSGLSDLGFSFCFDYVSFIFFSVVSLISGCVFIYSKYYMDISDDTNSDLLRFLVLLFLFVVSMFFLVFSFSWLSVFLGWDGLGLVSFFLVVYYNNSSSLVSGLVTVIMNRVGDCFFLVSFVFLFYCGWVNIDFISFYSCLFFMCFLFLGAITKSAQLPFSSWLPLAMAAPTPVSSLVHSSTLVTAGVYLLVRFNYLLEGVFSYLLFISLFTMSLAGLCACLESDFKKVVAMSTLSQLGFMVFSFSSGMWLFCYLHMIFHAFFKSILFLSTGSLMHLVLGNQESRFFGAFFSSFYSKLFFSMSCLSLMGFPFSLGFYSKDFIVGFSSSGLFSVVSILFSLSCCFTVSYSVRLLKMGFFSYPSFFPLGSFSESFYFYCPVVLLFFCCVFSGNFFFFNFFPFVDFSFFDCFLGIVIIFLGILFNSFSKFNYFFSWFFMVIGFVSLLTTSSVSSFFKRFNKISEYSWGEMVGAQGLVNYFFLFDNKSFGLWGLYFSSFVPIFIILGGVVVVVN